MQQLTCDYCGKQLGENEGFRLFYRHASILNQAPHKRHEFCNECGAKFQLWIAEAFVKNKLDQIEL